MVASRYPRCVVTHFSMSSLAPDEEAAGTLGMLTASPFISTARLAFT